MRTVVLVLSGAVAVACGGVAHTGERSDILDGGASDGNRITDEPSCRITRDYLRIDVRPANEPVDAGSVYVPPESTDTAFKGVVTAIGTSSFDVDTCPPNADCDASALRVWMEAATPKPFGMLREGAHVQVHFVRSCGVACTAGIVVSSLDDWGGLPNPRPPLSGNVYVVAEDGGGPLPAEAPYEVRPVKLDCEHSFGEGCGGDDPGIYALEFSSAETPTPLSVRMGEYGRVRVPDGTLSVRNLRSFVSGMCDDYWNFAHIATPAWDER